MRSLATAVAMPATRVPRLRQLATDVASTFASMLLAIWSATLSRSASVLLFAGNGVMTESIAAIRSNISRSDGSVEIVARSLGISVRDFRAVACNSDTLWFRS